MKLNEGASPTNIARAMGISRGTVYKGKGLDVKKNVRPPAARQRLQANAKAVKVNSPRNLTPALCDRLRLDLLNACRKVAETHGLTVEGGELSDIDLRHGFDIEFSVGIPMDDGSLYSVDRALFEVLA